MFLFYVRVVILSSNETFFVKPNKNNVLASLGCGLSEPFS